MVIRPKRQNYTYPNIVQFLVPIDTLFANKLIYSLTRCHPTSHKHHYYFPGRYQQSKIRDNFEILDYIKFLVTSPHNHLSFALFRETFALLNIHPSLFFMICLFLIVITQQHNSISIIFSLHFYYVALHLNFYASPVTDSLLPQTHLSFSGYINDKRTGNTCETSDYWTTPWGYVTLLL